jgi:hypothetical protein
MMGFRDRLQITFQKENDTSQTGVVFSLKIHKLKTALALYSTIMT